MPSSNKIQRDEGAPIPIDSRAQLIARTAIAVLVILLAAWIARDFLVALTWATVIAIAVWPVFTRFATAVAANRLTSLAPLLFTLMAGLALMVPIVSVAHQIGQESDAFARLLDHLHEGGIPVPAWLVRLPIAGEYLDVWWRANLSNPDVLVQRLRNLNAENITVWTSSVGGALLHRLFLFLVTLSALFIMLRDGARLADRTLTTACRLLGNSGEFLMRDIADAIRGTVNGTVIASILKGAVCGVAYVVAGVPHPLLFAELTIALAMIPLGAWAALAAAVLVLLVDGSTPLMATGLAGFGAVTLLIGDNLILPALIGGTVRLPFLLVVIGVIGGMQSFGVLGLFLGPVVMAALLTVCRRWIGVR